MQGGISAILQSLAILLLAGLLCLPCLIHGLPSTGDSILHTTYQYEFSRQFWGGEIYPRWMASANNGYGSPIFLIQYPLPYWITALLRPLTRFPPDARRESRELGVFCFLVLAAAGLNARLWFRKSYVPLAATAAAMFYITLPFLLAYELYTDFAIGQFVTFAWMPLALAACDSLRLRFRAVSGLGAAWTLLVLSNFLTSLLFLPVMVAYAIARREPEHEKLAKRLLAIALSLAIGTCAAGAYLLPFFSYLRLFDISKLLNLPGYELSDYFGYVRLSSLGKPLIVLALLSGLLFAAVAARSGWRARGSAALRALSLLSLGLGVLSIVPGLGPRLIQLSGLKPPIFNVVDYYPERVLAITLGTFALGVFAYSQLPEETGRRRDYTRWVLLVAACGAFILMLPWGAFFWKAAPVLARAVQFPCRLGVPLTIVVAGLLAAAMDNGLRRRADPEGNRPVILVTLVAIAVVASSILTWRADWTWKHLLRNPTTVSHDETDDVDHANRTYISTNHLPGFLNLSGLETDRDLVKPAHADPGGAYLVKGQGTVNLTRESPRKLLLSYTVSGEGMARLGVLYSPLWKIEEPPESSQNSVVESSTEGLLEVPLDPGVHDEELVFDGGRPERYGAILSLLSVLVVAAGVLIELAFSRTSAI
jgi:hypothetical protein